MSAAAPRPFIPRLANLAGRALAVLIILGVAGIAPSFFFEDFLTRHVPFYFSPWRVGFFAPGLWRTVNGSAPPPDSVYSGTWLPGEPGTHSTFTDGTPYDFALAGSSLQLRPDHTFQMIRLGKYDGNGRILCLVSEHGKWEISPEAAGPIYVLLNPLYDGTDAPLIEHNLAPAKTFEQWHDEQAAAQQKGYNQGRDVSIEEENEMDCSYPPLDARRFTFHLARRGARLALYGEASFPFTGLDRKLVLLEKQAR